MIPCIPNMQKYQQQLLLVAIIYTCTKGIQLTAAHSGGRCSDLIQDEVQHLWRYNLLLNE